MGEAKGTEILSPKGIKDGFNMEYEARLTGINELTSILEVVPSDTAVEEYFMTGSTNGMREAKGGLQIKELDAYSFTIKNRKWVGGLAIKPEDVRRDKTKQIMNRVSKFGVRCADHPLELLGGVINAAGSTKGFDGKNYFAADHQWGDSGVWSNDINAADNYAELNVADPENPTPLEISKIVGKMIQHQFSYLDDQNYKVNGQARQFVLHVPLNMWDAADQAFRSLTLETGTGVINNPRIGSRVSVTVIPNLDLTSATQIHLYRIDGSEKPYIWQEEVPVKVDVYWEGSPWHVMNDRYAVKAESWDNIGVGMHHAATRATLS